MIFIVFTSKGVLNYTKQQHTKYLVGGGELYLEKKYTSVCRSGQYWLNNSRDWILKCTIICKPLGNLLHIWYLLYHHVCWFQSFILWKAKWRMNHREDWHLCLPLPSLKCSSAGTDSGKMLKLRLWRSDPGKGPGFTMWRQHEEAGMWQLRVYF